MSRENLAGKKQQEQEGEVKRIGRGTQGAGETQLHVLRDLQNAGPATQGSDPS